METSKRGEEKKPIKTKNKTKTNMQTNKQKQNKTKQTTTKMKKKNNPNKTENPTKTIDATLIKLCPLRFVLVKRTGCIFSTAHGKETWTFTEITTTCLFSVRVQISEQSFRHRIQQHYLPVR